MLLQLKILWKKKYFLLCMEKSELKFLSEEKLTNIMCDQLNVEKMTNNMCDQLNVEQ